MKKALLPFILCIVSCLTHAQTSTCTSFEATVYAQQKMENNASPTYLVNKATASDGTSVSKYKADIASHLITLNINATAISGSINSISVYANNKEAIAGSLIVNGTSKSTPAGTAPSVYASNGQSDVVMVSGNSKKCKAYLLPNTLTKGIKVTVHTTDGKFYSQDFSNIAVGNNNITLTNTTANNLWMATIPGNTYFSFVSTPGAHDAATSGVTGIFASYAKCQGEDISTMLANGVRAFDLRPNYKNSNTITADNLYLYHGSYNTNVKYVDAMNTLVSFVKNNPSESISVIMLKEAGSGNSDHSPEMWSVINACHNEHSAYMKLLDHSYYTLDDFRGKICYINRTGTTCTNTTRITNWPDNNNVTNYSAAIGGTCYANIQDKYNTNGSDKQDEVKAMLQISSKNTEKKNFHYNFLSSAWSLGGSSPASYASKTNPVITTYLNEGNISGPTGYVYADYIGSSSNGGAGLLTAIINQNYRYVYNGRSYEGKVYVYEPGDVNGSGEIDINDLTRLIDILLGDADDVYGAADVNGDTFVNVADIDALVGILLNKK